MNHLFTRTVSILLAGALLAGCNETVFHFARFSRDETERLVWKQWAQNGDVEAQYKLGSLYCCGEKPDYHNQEALRWFCAAAKKGQRDAMLEVGKFYEGVYNIKGSSIPQNDVRALAYYQLALERQNHAAKGPIARMEGKLNEEQRKEAGELAKDWPNIPCRDSL